jgi:very-short-patch-repair endonuclease
MCLPLKLIIELDGETHTEQDDIQRDQIKDQRLGELGYQILRFQNEQVFDDLESVEAEIRKKIEELSSP